MTRQRRAESLNVTSGASMSVERSKSVSVAVSPISALSERSGRSQTIVLLDFPAPDIARALSPNGRAHWAAKKRAKTEVRTALWEALTRARPRPTAPPVLVRYRWVVPDRKKRDLDNHSTGVVKAVQDYLVQEGLFPGGDHSTALTSQVEIVYEKGQRRLEIVIEPAEGER